jgi:PAS domain S-box-containing protein
MFSLPVPRRLRPLPAYALALVSVGASWVVRYPLFPILQFAAPYSTFYLAVFLTGWAGGFVPGMVATLVSGLLAQYFLIEPLYSLRAANVSDKVGTLLFILTGALTSYLCESLRTATENSMMSAVRAKASARDAQIARERQRSILESIADGFLAFDHEWRISFSNDPAALILGRRREEVVGRHLVSLYPNTVLSEAYPRLREALDQRRSVHFDFYDDANDRWFGGSAYPSPAGVSLFIRDITAGRKLADAVRESEERFRIMADSAPLIIWTGTREGFRDYVNRFFLQFSGWEYDRALGDQWLELVHPEHRREVRDAYIAAAERQKVFSLEYRMRRKDGEYRWMLDSGAPRHSARGDYLGSIGTSLDITDRKRAEEAALESEAQLRLSMSVSQMGTWQRDLQNNVLTMSPELMRIVGCEPDAVDDPCPADFLFSLVHPDDREHLTKVTDPVFSKGGEYEVEYRFQRRDGEMRWMLERGQGFVDGNGRCLMVTGVGIDITERKLLEERVRHAQKLESLGVLAGGIAHDFNNLLTGILGSASLVIEDLPEDSETWNMQRNVIEASERAAQLTSQMLAYSGKGRFYVEDIDMARVVRDNLRLIQASMANKKVQLDIQLASEPCVVEADPAQMQQVVMNLVINATEAIPEDRAGIVHLATRIQILREESDGLRAGEYVVLEVSDTGTGMDADTASRIFDPFFTTKFMGRGLGLAAVQGIVRSHKGAIRVASSPGEGTTFTVTLPRSKGAPVDGADVLRPVWKTSETILIVDDEEVVRRAAAAALERFGYRVVLAEHGEQAVDLFRRDPFAYDAILLDLTMPLMNGEEVLPLLREIRPDIKVIVCSGYTEVEAMQRFSDLEAFIQKPYSSVHLAEKIRSVTNGAY